MKKFLLIFFLPILLFAQPSNRSLYTRDTSWVATRYWIGLQGYLTSAPIGGKLDTASFSSFFNNRFGLKTTANLAENTNLYYTDARARASINSTALGLSYSYVTGLFSWTSGYVGLTDSMRTYWSAKQAALGYTALDKADSTDATSYTTKKQFNDGQLLDVKKADSTGTGYATQNDLLAKLNIADSTLYATQYDLATGLALKIAYGDTTSTIPTKAFLSLNHYTKTQTNTLLGAKLDTTLATAVLRNQWSTAYTNTHTHSNKAKLDSLTASALIWNLTTASFTTGLKSTYDGYATSKINFTDTTSTIPTKIFLSQNHYTKTSINTFLNGKLDTTLASAVLRGQWNTAYSHTLLTNNPHSVTATQVGLGSVENTALSTWAGTTNLTTGGAFNPLSLKLRSNGSVIDSAKVSSDSLNVWVGVTKFKLQKTYPVGGSATWGTITGTLSAQTDLQNALNAKLDTANATASSRTNWSTAYTDRLKWDGGSTGLVASTGRTSLGLGTMALTDSVYIKSLIALKLNIADSTGNGYATQYDISLKQNSLGFTALDKADSTDVTSYTTKKQFNDGQLLDVKKTDSTGTGYATQNDLLSKQDTTYLSGLGSNVQVQINGKQASLGYTALDKADSTDATSYTTKLQFNTGQLLDVKKADSTSVNGYATQSDLTGKVSTSGLNDSTKFLDSRNGFSKVHDADLAITDVTTNNVSSTVHGFAPKTPNDSTKFLRGNGTWGASTGGNSTTIVLSKSANEDVQNSTTLQDDNDLYFSATANSVYLIEIELMIYNLSASNGGIKVAFNAPTSSTVDLGLSGGYWQSALNPNPAYFSYWNSGIQTAIGVTYTGNIGNATATMRCVARIATSSTAGTINFQWAQNAADNAGATRLIRGCYLIAHKQ